MQLWELSSLENWVSVCVCACVRARECVCMHLKPVLDACVFQMTMDGEIFMDYVT